MFKISDECYAVENAMEELKEYATGIINSNLRFDGSCGPRGSAGTLCGIAAKIG
jgi:hypothetical protein